MRCVMLGQLLIQIAAPPLHGQQQETQEIEQGKNGVDAHVGGFAADFLDADGFVAAIEAGGEDKMGLVGGAEIAHEEVREDGASGIEGGRVGIVLRVPFVFALGELFGGVFGAQCKVPFCLVGLAFCVRCVSLSRSGT